MELNSENVSEEEEAARSHFIHTEDKNALFCFDCQIVIFIENSTDICSKHRKTENHIKNADLPNTFITQLSDELIETIEAGSGKIIACEGEKLDKSRRRVFCLNCDIAMDGKVSIVKRHVKGKNHKIKVGKQLNSIDEIISEHSGHIQRNAESKDNIDCLVCDGLLTAPNKKNCWSI